MESIGSEVGQKMRSAIKAKLTELGCYVDDELPDYVMVMVANKRTRSQMEDDLQLFLSSNTQVFVNWLHQVLQKLQEVSVNTNLEQKKLLESKRKSSEDSLIPTKKERKDKKEEKSKAKVKKAKKAAKKKIKSKKSGKRDKSSSREADKAEESGGIRRNVPPLMMNPEKESSPSITDVFAGQILKTQASKMGVPKEADKSGPARRALNRNRFPIIDPATVSQSTELTDTFDIPSLSEVERTASILKLPRDEQIKEMNAIEAKIQGLKKKLAEQFESGSEDEDFLNIRTEAEELMGDFNDDNIEPVKNTQIVLPGKSNHLIHEITEVETPRTERLPIRPPTPPQPELPSIELNLPKRPLRDRLGSRDKSITSFTMSSGSTIQRSVNMVNPLNMAQDNQTSSRIDASRSSADELADRRTSIKSRLSLREESSRVELPKPPEEEGGSAKRLSSRVTVAREWSPPASTAGVGSVVRVPPRPRPNPGTTGAASSLLMRAVADAHKSLVDNPAKVEIHPSSVKKATVLPMRRNVIHQNIIIEVSRSKVKTPPFPSVQDSNSELEIDLDTESMGDLDSEPDQKKSNDEYVPVALAKASKSKNICYVPTHIDEMEEDDMQDPTLVAKILNRPKDSSPSKGTRTQFVVTLDGLDPNLFLNKKLENEEINSESEPPILKNSHRNRCKNPDLSTEKKVKIIRIIHEKDIEKKDEVVPEENSSIAKDTETEKAPGATCKKETKEEIKIPPKRRKGSPIVFDVSDKKKVETQTKTRERTSSGDDALTVTIGSTKYEGIATAPEPRKSLPLSVLPAVSTCRMFPMCKFGSACLFTHPPCKFASTCIRRDCIYSHTPAGISPDMVPSTPPIVASRVVPASNYKSVTTAGLPSVCKFYPNCNNPSCHFYHPKMCRYGKNCLNRLECNFYHHDAGTPTTPPASALKWKSPFHV